VALKYDGEADIVTFTTAAMRSPQSLSVTREGRLDAEQVSSRFGPHKVTADYVHGRFV
jgi:hypothetical protein